MKSIRRLILSLGVLVLVFVVGGILFSGMLFESVLRSSLGDFGYRHGIDLAFESARLSVFGEAGLTGFRATEIESRETFAQVAGVDVKFSPLSLFSETVVVDYLGITAPQFDLHSSLVGRLQTLVKAGGESSSTARVDQDLSAVKQGRSRGVLLRSGEVKDGRVSYRLGDSDQQLVAQVDAEVKDLSESQPFEFEIKADLSGESSGALILKGQVDPETLAGQVNLALNEVEMPLSDGRLPATHGAVTLIFKDQFRDLVSTGNLQIKGAPPGIPTDLLASNELEINWRLESVLPADGGGPIELKALELAFLGLKGGPQSIVGKGSYDPEQMVGDFNLSSEDFSLALLNPFIETGLGWRVLSGKGNLSARLQRSGSDTPFQLDARSALAGLALKDLSGANPTLKFDQVKLTTQANYDEGQDLLKLDKLEVALDDIALAVQGTVASLLDASGRSLDLSVRNDKLVLEKIVPLAAPDLEAKGRLEGLAGIDLKISGKVDSPKFPVLDGNLTLSSVRFTPADRPDLPIGLKGQVTFDANDLRAEDLDLNLGNVPGKASILVKGYNEERREVLANVSGIAIEPLVNLYKPELSGILLGNLDGQARAILGKTPRPEALEIEFQIGQGRMLTRHPVPAAIVNAVNWDWLRNGYDLTEAFGKIVQDERGYRMDPVVLMGAKGGLAFSGWLTFTNRMETTARLNVDRNNLDEVPGFLRRVLRGSPESRYAHLDVPLRGEVNRPRVDLNLAVDIGSNLLQQELQEELDGSLGDRAREVLGEDTDRVLQGAGDLLQGLFGR